MCFSELDEILTTEIRRNKNQQKFEVFFLYWKKEIHLKDMCGIIVRNCQMVTGIFTGLIYRDLKMVLKKFQ